MFKYIVLFALVGAVLAGVAHDTVEVKSEKNDVRADGFDSELTLDNGASQKASGDEHGNIHGSFEWVDDHGEHVAITYVADENGYQPSGSVIPTPHPIPEAIVKAIEYIKAHPSKDH